MKAVTDSGTKRFNPLRAAVQMATARFFVGPFHYWYNHLSVEGHEHVPDKGPFLVVSNHISYFDPPIVVIAVDRPMGFIAKKELFEKPLLRPLIDFFGAIEIDRDKPSLSSIRKVKQVFKAGWSVGIFIEGTRNKTPGTLGQPHVGPAYFAWTNKVRILPVGLLKTKATERSQGAIVRFGPMIDASEDLDATTWRIMANIAELIGWSLPERNSQKGPTLLTASDDCLPRGKSMAPRST